MQPITPHECSRIAQDLQIRKVQVESVIQLLDESNTVPFITRYRKERTGGVNEEVIRQIQARVSFLRSLNDRKQTILKTIQAQGKLSDELREAILKADTTKRLEDLYLPYKPKKRSLATSAREKGLDPLALAIWHSDPAADNLEELLPGLVNPEKELNGPDDVRLGVQHILAEMTAEAAPVRAAVRQVMWETGKVTSAKHEKLPEGQGLEYKDYFQFNEPARHIPAHRILALNRGEKEGAVKVKIEYDQPAVANRAVYALAEHLLTQVGKMPAPSPPPVPASAAPVSAPAAASSEGPSPPGAEAPPTEPAATGPAEGQAALTGLEVSGEAPPPPPQTESVAAPENAPQAANPQAAEQVGAVASAGEVTAAAAPSAEMGAGAPQASAAPTSGAAGLGLAPTQKIEMKGEPLVADVGFKSPHVEFFKKVLEDTLQRLLLPSLEREVRGELTDEAEGHAAAVFARNLRSLLLQPPLHGRRILAIDPGFRTGCKLAVLDEYGNLLDHAIIHPFTPMKKGRERKGQESRGPQPPAPQPAAASPSSPPAAPEGETSTSSSGGEQPSVGAEAPVTAPEGAPPAAAPPAAAPPAAAPPAAASPAAASPAAASPAAASPEAASPEAASPEAASPEAASPEAAPQPVPEAVQVTTPESPPAEGAVPLPPGSDGMTLPAPASTDAAPAPAPASSGESQAPAPDRRSESKAKLIELIKKHNLQVVALGNGTGCRETEEIVAELIAGDAPELSYVIVNEAGASVYSVSPVGREEFPDLDSVTRSTVSIGRRLQDPLAELVKVDPQHIGVGLYQHDLGRKELRESLEAVVESCVNQVGVNVNTASIPLLRHVSGLNQMVARELVEHRKQHGPFQSRESLQQIPGLGPQRFVQAAGFLKIPEGPNPLDRTWIHPESYALAEKILAELGYAPAALGDRTALEEMQGKIKGLKPEELAQRLDVGVPTVQDILQALARPGLDPREELPPPIFKKGILKVEDLQPGMELKGTVLNVVDFGAFVDIGLKDSGLVHISQMANRYIKSPYDVVAVNDVVTVWVLAVDKERNRVSLSMIKPGTERRPQERRPPAPRERAEGGRPPRGRGRGGPRPGGPPVGAATGAPAEGPAGQGGGPGGGGPGGGGPGGGGPGGGGPGGGGQGGGGQGGGRPPRGRQGGGQGGPGRRGPGRGPSGPPEGGQGGERPQETRGQGRPPENRPQLPPRRPRREPPRPKLTQDKLEGKASLRTFGELSAFFQAKTHKDPPPPRPEEKPPKTEEAPVPPPQTEQAAPPPEQPKPEQGKVSENPPASTG